jgi:hypothetical protein
VAYPSDGRFFSVKLSSSGDVTNVRPAVIEFATVTLSTDDGDVWEYVESEPGLYLLLNPQFKAEPGVMYKLRIELTDESIFESNWEGLPGAEAPPMGDINFSEVSLEKYAIEAREKVVVSVDGIQTQIDMPEKGSGESFYYRWSFIPHWIYIPPLTPTPPLGKKCWATNPYYLSHYALQLDNVGGYRKNLFFMETIRNERIFHRFSTLIIQHSMTQDYYYFWKEMQEQNESSQLIDKPPFNLDTNFQSLTGEKRVSGYFGVVQEQAKRWYFDKKDLSYFVENTLQKDCNVPYQDKAPECFDCREYSFGITTNVKPSWWMD